MTIDYTKLNDRIVKQAWEVSNLILTEEQKQKLFKNKIERAKVMIESQRKEAVYFKIEN